MKRILIERKPSVVTHCESFLTMAGKSILAGLERPWIENPTGTPGGKPYESCVPVGVYETKLYTRPDPNPDDDKPPQEVIALINPDLGVYYLEDDMPDEGGRFLILLGSLPIAGMAPGRSFSRRRLVSSAGLMTISGSTPRAWMVWPEGA